MKDVPTRGAQNIFFEAPVHASLRFVGSLRLFVFYREALAPSLLVMVIINGSTARQHRSRGVGNSPESSCFPRVQRDFCEERYLGG